MSRKKTGWNAYVVCTFFAVSVPATMHAADRIYKTTDEYGIPEYSNTQEPGSVVVDVPEISVIPAPQPYDESTMRDPMQPPLELAQDTTRQEVRQRSGNIYNLQIVKPENNETVSIAGATVQVELALDPPLDVAAGHRIQVVVDGVVSTETRQTRISLPGLDRGGHQLEVRVVNDRDEVVQSTNAITFFAQQPVVFPSASR
jgi:hypothetical protein